MDIFYVHAKMEFSNMLFNTADLSLRALQMS